MQDAQTFHLNTFSLAGAHSRQYLQNQEYLAASHLSPHWKIHSLFRLGKYFPYQNIPD